MLGFILSEVILHDGGPGHRPLVGSESSRGREGARQRERQSWSKRERERDRESVCVREKDGQEGTRGRHTLSSVRF